MPAYVGQKGGGSSSLKAVLREWDYIAQGRGGTLQPELVLRELRY